MKSFQVMHIPQLIAALVVFLPFSCSMRILESNSLGLCMTNSSFFATLFHVAFTPDNKTLSFKLDGVSQISANVLLDLQVLGYGYSVFHPTIDPCENDFPLPGLCPMNQGRIPDTPQNVPVDQKTLDRVPGRFSQLFFDCC
jgi:ML-like domain